MQENVKESIEKEEKEPQKMRVGLRQRVADCMRELLWMGAAYLLGTANLLFGTMPLGLGLLCASTKHTVFILAGLIISAVSHIQMPIVYICTYVAAALIRVVSGLILDHPDARVELPDALKEKLKREPLEEAEGSRAKKIRRKLQAAEHGQAGSVLLQELRMIFSESVCLRMCTAAVCSLIISLYHIIEGGFLFYDLFGAIFTLLVAPAAVMVWSVAIEDRIKHAALRLISEATLGFALVWAANGFLVLGFSLPILLGTAFTLFACQKHGVVCGVCFALFFGIAYSPLYAPAFLLAALVFSFLQSHGKEGSGSLLAVLAMSVWALYVGGLAVFLQALPAGLAAGASISLLQKLQPVEEQPGLEKKAERVKGDCFCYQDSSERFRGISDAFSSLSEMFYNLSDRFRRPGTLDLRRICDGAFDAFCQDCPNKTVCWGLEYSDTLGVVNELISRLHTHGKVGHEQVPEGLLCRCDSMELILDRINRDCARLTGEMLKNNRTEIFAMDYEAAARIINDALEEDDGEYRFDSEQEKRVAEYLKDAGFGVGSVTVYGKRRRRIMVRDIRIEQSRVTVDTMRSDLGEMCGLSLGRPMFSVEQNISTMTLWAQKKIAVIGAQNNLSADGGVSGDTVNLFCNKKDYFYALISDGMGAGREAAFTSNLCSVFLEKMLRAGNRASTSLRMLNNLICSREADSTRECSTTVDLLELDLMTGEASFIKSGAAPSFIVRGNVVHRLQLGTAPIGIIRTVETQATPFLLRAGDTVVLVSDGILQEDEDCVWLTDYLAQASEQSPEEIVYKICLHAAAFENHDDCSAIALRILSAEE